MCLCVWVVSVCLSVFLYMCLSVCLYVCLIVNLTSWGMHKGRAQQPAAKAPYVVTVIPYHVLYFLSPTSSQITGSNRFLQEHELYTLNCVCQSSTLHSSYKNLMPGDLKGSRGVMLALRTNCKYISTLLAERFDFTAQRSYQNNSQGVASDN